MVNTNIQASVPIAGPGKVYRPAGNYGPGEYPTFYNCEVTKEGTVRQRRPLFGVNTHITFTGSFSLSYDSKFIGFIGDFAISFHKKQKHVGVSADGFYQTLWDPVSLPANEYLVGAFEYNGRLYWISSSNVGVSATKTFYLYHCLSKAVGNVLFTDLTKVALFTSTGTFRRFFVHKDRLFIATDEGIWFSKATDITVFAVPDGGFFYLKGRSTLDALSLGNSVIILTNTGIDLFTYSVDPNQDSQLRTAVANFKAYGGCIHKSTPYIVGADGIYAMINNYVDKVFDWPIDMTPAAHGRLESMEDSLVYVLGHNQAYVFNLDTKSSYIMTVEDKHDSIDRDGRFRDVISPTFGSGYTSSPRTFFLVDGSMAIDDGAGGSITQYRSTVYRMIHRRGSSFEEGTDVVLLGSGTRQYVMPRIEVELRNITPDGNKYLKKKFRSLQITAITPNNNLICEVGFDGHYYPLERRHALAGSSPNTANIYVNDVAGNAFHWNDDPETTLYVDYSPSFRKPDPKDLRYPHIFRIPLGQRAHSISIRFRSEARIFPVPINPNWSGPNSEYPYNEWYNGFFELMDLRYYWSYTNRAAANKANFTNP